MHDVIGKEDLQLNFNIQNENFNIKWINIFFKVMWVMTLVLFTAIPFKIEWLQRICYWTYTLLNIICFAMAFMEKLKDEKQKRKRDTNFLLLVLVVFITWVSLQFTGTFEATGDNLIDYLSFIGILFAIYYSCYVKTEFKDLKFIGMVNICIAVLFAVLSRMSFAYGRNDMWTKSLTLGFSNPNMVAMLIFANTVFLLLVKELFNKHILKLFIVALIIYNIYMLYLTQARSSFAAVIIVLAIYFLKHNNFKIHPVITVLCVIFPFLFVFGYTYLYEHNYFKDLEILGKTIYSGREKYYLEILSELKRYDFGLIFGHFTEFQNTHNSALSLIRFFGVSGMVAYYIFILTNIFGLVKKKFSNKVAYTCFIAILALYIQSCAESAIILGGGAWLVFTLSLYAVAGMEKKEKVSGDEKHEGNYVG